MTIWNVGQTTAAGWQCQDCGVTVPWGIGHGHPVTNATTDGPSSVADLVAVRLTLHRMDARLDRIERIPRLDRIERILGRLTPTVFPERCGWCLMPEDVTQHAPGHDDEPETNGRHRFRPGAA